MNTESFVAITKRGIQRMTITRQDLEITQDIVDSICKNKITEVPFLFDLNERTGGTFGRVHLRVKNGVNSMTVEVFKVHLNCPFVIEQGVAVPQFDSKTAPMLSLQWEVPAGMRLRLVVNLSASARHVSTFLTALDSGGRTWRLPLSNTHDHCQLCTGEYAGSHGSHLDSLMAALDQFTKSAWNTDLYNGTDEKLVDNTRNMFRFQPSDQEFKQLPMRLTGEGQDWTSLCVKVGNSELSEMITTSH